MNNRILFLKAATEAGFNIEWAEKKYNELKSNGEVNVDTSNTDDMILSVILVALTESLKVPDDTPESHIVTFKRAAHKIDRARVAIEELLASEKRFDEERRRYIFSMSPKRS